MQVFFRKKWIIRIYRFVSGDPDSFLCARNSEAAPIAMTGAALSDSYMKIRIEAGNDYCLSLRSNL